MSFDEYAEHIYQKHRLCVAIAVLKSKPPELPSLRYLEQLKSNMVDNMDDDDVTICSDDFLMDYEDETNDSVTILKDFDVRNVDDILKNFNVEGECERDEHFQGDQERIDDEPAPYIPEELSQATSYNSSQSQILPTTINPNIAEANYYENQNTHQQYNSKNIPNNINNITSTDTNINILSQEELSKDVSKKTNTLIPPVIVKKSNIVKVNNDHTQPDNIDKNNDIEIDSQKTILYTVPAFTQNYTHFSASQAEIRIPNNYIHPAEKKKPRADVIEKSELIASIKEVNTNVTHKHLQNTEIIKEQKEITRVPNENMPKDISANLLVNSQQADRFSQMIDKCLLKNQNARLENTQPQENAINNENKDVITNGKELEYSQNLDDYFKEIQSFIDKENIENMNDNNTLSLQYANERIVNVPKNSDNITNSLNLISNKDTNPKDIQENNINAVTLNEELNNEIKEDNENGEEMSSVEEEAASVEVIPYKVLAELSKVKMFLRRGRRMSCDGFSTDSGYRSDSQIRSSGRALQLSGKSINQSAYSLLNHIVQCPLVAATRDITAEISQEENEHTDRLMVSDYRHPWTPVTPEDLQSLGQLINRLHEEETYPPFLEELLDTVDILLRQVYKGAVSDCTEFLKKDEFLERLLLLNRSIHIQKHTIEKITTMLTKFHEKLTDENVTYELTNIDEIENSCYIFHILEILLKKYIKNKTLSSQSNTQLSQDEDRVLKKSALTDIWRRKWNPNLKEDSNEGSRENRCVLKSCSAILNKIVVDCVNSYSLVAFSALKCFNSMQS